MMTNRCTGPPFDETVVDVGTGVTLFVASTTGPPEDTLLVIHGGPDTPTSASRSPDWPAAAGW